MRSKKLKEFTFSIQYKNRNPMDSSVLKELDKRDSNPFTIVKPGTVFYRSRLVDSGSENIGIDSVFKGFSKEESFVPPKDRSKNFRASYKYIPYLYVSSSEDIAIKEVRPSLYSFISIAEIYVNEELMLFDLCKTKSPDSDNRNIKDNLLIDLAELFGKPVDIDGNEYDYIPTQYIAEYIKNMDYDGIIYPSTRAEDEDGYNVVIFNYEKCEPINSKLIAYPIESSNK